MNLQESRVLVTGGAKRVGKNIALKLAEKGAKVAISYRTSEKEALETLEELEEISEAKAVQANLRDISQIEKMLTEINDDFGGIDLLVNNAAVFYRTPLEKVKNEDWEIMLETNLKAPFFCSQTLVKNIWEEETKERVIINIADWSGERPYKDYLPYCISKAGVIALTKGLAKELAPEIRVNAVSPGPVMLPPDLPEQEKREVLENTPLGEGSPEYISDAVIFLAENEFMTGAVIPVEGGRLIS